MPYTLPSPPSSWRPPHEGLATHLVSPPLQARAEYHKRSGGRVHSSPRTGASLKLPWVRAWGRVLEGLSKTQQKVAGTQPRLSQWAQGRVKERGSGSTVRRKDTNEPWVMEAAATRGRLGFRGAMYLALMLFSFQGHPGPKGEMVRPSVFLPSLEGWGVGPGLMGHSQVPPGRGGPQGQAGASPAVCASPRSPHHRREASQAGGFST